MDNEESDEDPGSLSEEEPSDSTSIKSTIKPLNDVKIGKRGRQRKIFH